MSESDNSGSDKSNENCAHSFSGRRGLPRTSRPYSLRVAQMRMILPMQRTKTRKARSSPELSESPPALALKGNLVLQDLRIT